MRSERNQACADQMLARNGIHAMVVNTGLTEVLSGRLPYWDGFARFVLDLPQYHDVSSEASLRKPREFLFLGKNYPNVNLDLCWANAIDPAYCVEFFKRAVMTVPHTKVMGFGGDTHLFEMQIGSAIQARDNIAIALGELVDSAWLSHAAALDVARAWLFDNPNRLCGLNVAG